MALDLKNSTMECLADKHEGGLYAKQDRNDSSALDKASNGLAGSDVVKQDNASSYLTQDCVLALLMKSSTVGKDFTIKSLQEKHGFDVLGQHTLQLSSSQMDTLYAYDAKETKQHYKDLYEGWKKSSLSDPVEVLILGKENAVVSFQALVNLQNSTKKKDRMMDPQSVYASANQDNVKRDVMLLLGTSASGSNNLGDSVSSATPADDTTVIQTPLETVGYNSRDSTTEEKPTLLELGSESNTVVMADPSGNKTNEPPTVATADVNTTAPFVTTVPSKELNTDKSPLTFSVDDDTPGTKIALMNSTTGNSGGDNNAPESGFSQPPITETTVELAPNVSALAVEAVAGPPSHTAEFEVESTEPIAQVSHAPELTTAVSPLPSLPLPVDSEEHAKPITQPHAIECENSTVPVTKSPSLSFTTCADKNSDLKGDLDNNTSDLKVDAVTSDTKVTSVTNDANATPDASNPKADAISSDLEDGTTTSDLKADATTSDLKADATTSELEVDTITSDLEDRATTSDLKDGATTSDLKDGATISDLKVDAITSDTDDTSNTSALKVDAITSDLEDGVTPSDLKDGAIISDLEDGATISDLKVDTITSDTNDTSNTSALKVDTLTSDTNDTSNTSALKVDAITSDLKVDAITRDLKVDTITSDTNDTSNTSALKVDAITSDLKDGVTSGLKTNGNSTDSKAEVNNSNPDVKSAPATRTATATAKANSAKIPAKDSQPTRVNSARKQQEKPKTTTTTQPRENLPSVRKKLSVCTTTKPATANKVTSPNTKTTKPIVPPQPPLKSKLRATTRPLLTSKQPPSPSTEEEPKKKAPRIPRVALLATAQPKKLTSPTKEAADPLPKKSKQAISSSAIARLTAPTASSIRRQQGASSVAAGTTPQATKGGVTATFRLEQRKLRSPTSAARPVKPVLNSDKKKEPTQKLATKKKVAPVKSNVSLEATVDATAIPHVDDLATTKTEPRSPAESSTTSSRPQTPDQAHRDDTMTQKTTMDTAAATSSFQQQKQSVTGSNVKELLSRYSKTEPALV